MTMDIRKYGIMIAVTILVAILIYALADATAGPKPIQNCWNNRITIATPQGPQQPAPQKAYTSGLEVNCTVPAMNLSDRDSCTAAGGDYNGVQDQNGCVASYECSMCNKQFNDATQSRDQIFFYTSIIAGLVAIIAGFILPLGSIHEWVGLGFIFGGVIGLFIGTIAYWSDLGRWYKPLLLAAELAIVLFIIYRRMKTAEPKVTKKK